MKWNSINNCDYLKFIIRITAAILITCHGHQKPSYATDIGCEPSSKFETKCINVDLPAQHVQWSISKQIHSRTLKKLPVSCETHVDMTCNIGCPTRYRNRHFFNNFTTNEDMATKFEADYRHTLQTHSFSFLTQRTYSCNTFIGVRIIKEMPGSVASGTHCIIQLELHPFSQS